MGSGDEFLMNPWHNQFQKNGALFTEVRGEIVQQSQSTRQTPDHQPSLIG